jgi:hypothetical protein
MVIFFFFFFPFHVSHEKPLKMLLFISFCTASEKREGILPIGNDFHTQKHKKSQSLGI